MRCATAVGDGAPMHFNVRRGVALPEVQRCCRNSSMRWFECGSKRQTRPSAGSTKRAVKPGRLRGAHHHVCSLARPAHFLRTAMPCIPSPTGASSFRCGCPMLTAPSNRSGRSPDVGIPLSMICARRALAPAALHPFVGNTRAAACRGDAGARRKRSARAQAFFDAFADARHCRGSCQVDVSREGGSVRLALQSGQDKSSESGIGGRYRNQNVVPQSLVHEWPDARCDRPPCLFLSHQRTSANADALYLQPFMASNISFLISVMWVSYMLCAPNFFSCLSSKPRLVW